jgi:hypothetical protein
MAARAGCKLVLFYGIVNGNFRKTALPRQPWVDPDPNQLQVGIRSPCRPGLPGIGMIQINAVARQPPEEFAE